MKLKYISILCVLVFCQNLLAESYYSALGGRISELTLESDDPEAVFSALIRSETDEKVELLVPKFKFRKERFSFKNTRIGIALQEVAERFGLHFSITSGSRIVFTVKAPANESVSFDHLIFDTGDVSNELEGIGLKNWFVARGLILGKDDMVTTIKASSKIVTLRCNEAEWKLAQSILLLHSRGFEVKKMLINKR